jgi:hypothetical protein
MPASVAEWSMFDILAAPALPMLANIAKSDHG